MARNKADAGPRSVVDEWMGLAPWLLVGVGGGLTLLSLALPGWPGTFWVLLRVAPVVISLLAAGVAVWLRLRSAGQKLEERAASAGLVACAALVPLLGFIRLDPAWDVARLLLGVLTAVALIGALLLLLPSVARRVAVSLLVVFHFVGILTAVTSVPPPGSEPPWLVTTLWGRVFRPYLQFMYLNNAYHFYSPEPGPPELLWFHLAYTDGSERWVRIPERDQFFTRQEYQRRLALTESVNQLSPVTPPDFAEGWQRRQYAGNAVTPPIPVRWDLAANIQYREPLAYSKLMLSSYARHVAQTWPTSEKHPDAPLEGVKVYRVVHEMLLPGQINQGARASDPTLYTPYYQGEFDRDGNLLDGDFHPASVNGQPDPAAGAPQHRSHFLYWLIPVMRVPRGQVKDRNWVAGVSDEERSRIEATQETHPLVHEVQPDETVVVDFTKLHARLKRD
jgi:hypothetical protein